MVRFSSRSKLDNIGQSGQNSKLNNSDNMGQFRQHYKIQSKWDNSDNIRQFGLVRRSLFFKRFHFQNVLNVLWIMNNFVLPSICCFLRFFFIVIFLRLELVSSKVWTHRQKCSLSSSLSSLTSKQRSWVFRRAHSLISSVSWRSAQKM